MKLVIGAVEFVVGVDGILLRGYHPKENIFLTILFRVSLKITLNIIFYKIEIQRCLENDSEITEVENEEHQEPYAGHRKFKMTLRLRKAH